MGIVMSLLVKAPVEALANTLANDIAKRYPPALDNSSGKLPSVNRLTRIVEDACNKAAGFQAQYRLGWLGKAKLGNDFRWALNELGYSKEFVDFATEAVVVRISQKTPPI